MLGGLPDLQWQKHACERLQPEYIAPAYHISGLSLSRICQHDTSIFCLHISNYCARLLSPQQLGAVLVEPHDVAIRNRVARQQRRHQFHNRRIHICKVFRGL